MNNYSSSCHLPLILIWKESTRHLIALNSDHEKPLNNKKDCDKLNKFKI